MRAAVSAPLAVVLALALTSAGGARRPDGANEAPQGALRLAGVVRGLYPGAREPLQVRVWNPLEVPVRVVWLTARAEDASESCSRDQLWIGHFHGPLVVPARRARVAVLPVTMRRSAPDSCKRAVFPLELAAWGRRA